MAELGQYLGTGLTVGELDVHHKTHPGRVGEIGYEFDLELEARMHQAVLDNIVVPDVSVDNLPTIVILAGPCRTATGALATVYALADGVHGSHIQPGKTNRREEYSMALTGQGIRYARRTLCITPNKGTEIVKETLGMSTQAEFFNPLQPFLDIGYPGRIIVVGTLRDPLVTYDSCVAMWDRDWIQPNGINASFELTHNMLQQARDLGIVAIPYIHEMADDLGPHAVVERLLALTGVDYHPGLVDWSNGEGYEKTITYEVPPQRFVAGSLSRSNGGRGGFRWKEHGMVLSSEEQKAISPQLYESYQVYQQELAICRRVFGF